MFYTRRTLFIETLTFILGKKQTLGAAGRHVGTEVPGSNSRNHDKSEVTGDISEGQISSSGEDAKPHV
jgi:hypothetical protein